MSGGVDSSVVAGMMNRTVEALLVVPGRVGFSMALAVTPPYGTKIVKSCGNARIGANG